MHTRPVRATTGPHSDGSFLVACPLTGLHVTAGTTRYRLISCLGRGGFGEVYLASVQRPGGLERQRAVKLLRADLERPDEALHRLRDEGRLLAVMQHPAIVAVEDIVRLSGRIGLVMEYVDGSDVRRLHKAHVSIPPTVSLEIASSVADALASAVELPSPRTGRPLRLVHRDVKPGNIVISKYGRVKLLDFGVARTHELQRDTQTEVGELPMTVAYAAPEVLLQRVQQPPSDVFALGVTLYGMFTQEKLFRGMKLADQLRCVLEAGKYQGWLDERLNRVGHERVRGVLGEMLAWSPSDRIDAVAVRERCEALSRQIHGPSLRQWTRQMELPPIPKLDTPLVGEVLEEEASGGEMGRPSTGTSTPPPIPGLLAGRMLSPPAAARAASLGGSPGGGGGAAVAAVSQVSAQTPTPQSNPTLTPEPSFTSEVDVGNLRPGTRPDHDDDAGKAPPTWLYLVAALAGVLLIGLALAVVGAGAVAWYLTG